MKAFAMINTETSPRPISPAQRILGWVGLWLCSTSLMPVLWLWSHSFTPHQPLRLPHPGTSFFWILLGLNVLVASLMTYSVWSDQQKPKRRRPAPAPADAKSRWRSVGAGGLIAGYLVLRVMAGSPGASLNWVGVISGVAALGVLMALVGQCTRLIAPPLLPEEPVRVNFQPPPVAPTLPLGVRPPKNPYRAEVSGREAVYRQPLSTRIFMGVLGLILGTAAVGSEGFALLGLGVPLWGMHSYQHNPAEVLLMGGGGIFMGGIAFSTLLMTGPRELRVSTSDGTYAYRLSSPIRWPFLKAVTDDSNRTLLGLPWKTTNYRGSTNDIAGIQRRETTYKSTTHYSLLLCWHDPSRPTMQVGHSTDEAKARALQAQAAGDLGVPLLPDEVV